MTDKFQQSQSNEALMRRRQVEQLVSLSRSALYAAVKAGSFPRQYSIGPRSVAWKKSEVLAWVEARPQVGISVRGEEP